MHRDTVTSSGPNLLVLSVSHYRLRMIWILAIVVVGLIAVLAELLLSFQKKPTI